MKEKLIVFILFTAMLFVSCDNDNDVQKGGTGSDNEQSGGDNDQNDGGDVELPEGAVLLRLSMLPSSPSVLSSPSVSNMRSSMTYAESGFGGENFIKDITILIFAYTNDGTGVLQTTEHISLESLPANQTKWTKDSTLIVSGMKEISQTKNIYVIANWSSASPAYNANDFVVGVTTESQIKAKLTAISARITASTTAQPLTMQGNKLNYNFGNESLRASVGLARAVAKIRLSVEIDPDFLDKYPSIKWSDATVRMRAVNVPNRAFVVGRTPASTPTKTNDSAYALIHYAFAGAASKAGLNTWSDSTYVYENPIIGSGDAVKNKAIHIIVHIPYTKDGVKHNDNYYKIYVNNSAHTDRIYSVERNYIYDVKTQIKGFGMSEGFADPDFVPTTLSVRGWR